MEPAPLPRLSWTGATRGLRPRNACPKQRLRQADHLDSPQIEAMWVDVAALWHELAILLARQDTLGIA